MVLWGLCELHEFYAITGFRINFSDHADARRIELVFRHIGLERRVVARHQTVTVAGTTGSGLGFSKAFDRDHVFSLAVGNFLSNGLTDDRREWQQYSWLGSVAAGLPGALEPLEVLVRPFRVWNGNSRWE